MISKEAVVCGYRLNGSECSGIDDERGESVEMGSSWKLVIADDIDD